MVVATNLLSTTTFSFTAAGDPNTELLMNPDLEELPPIFGSSWELTQVAGGNLPSDDTALSAGFANRPDSGGQLGVWLKSFTGDDMQPADAIISQTVPGQAGGDYTFSGWSNFQTNYSGGDAAFNTQTIMEMAFLDDGGQVIGSPLTLDLFADGQTNGGGWMEHTINGTAPAGTASVRVLGAGLGMETNPLGGQQSAFFDDFSLDGPGLTVTGDFNGDGDWDCADVNALTAAIATSSTDLSFDMNADGMVTVADLMEAGVGWLAVGGANNPTETGGNPFLAGDANLSGDVDGQDFLIWNDKQILARRCVVFR